MESIDDEQHWVENLFPPRFKVTLDDILKSAGEICEENESGERDRTENRRREPSVFEQLASGVTPTDTSAIKNVYERVWLMTHLEEQQKQERQEKGADVRRSRNVSTSTADLVDFLAETGDQPCIWDTGELEQIRGVFKGTKQENIKLKARLAENNLFATRLQSKCKQQSAAIEELQGRVAETEKANNRLHILAVNAKKQLDEESRKVGILTDEVRVLQTERSDRMREVHELRKALDRQKLERSSVEARLKHQNMESAREQKLEEQKLNMLHQEDIDFLREKMRQLATQLEEEQQAHRRTKLGLSHLRQHFSSLPTAGENVPSNVVSKNQLQGLEF